MKYFVEILIKDLDLAHGLQLYPYLRRSGQEGSSTTVGPWSLFWRYFLADFLFSFTIVTFAVVGFWRGTWDITPIYLDDLVFDGEKWKGLLLLFVVGFLGVQAIQTSHSLFKRHTLSKDSKMNYRVNSKVFSLFWGFMDIYLWRSVWESIDLLLLPYASPLTLGCATLSIGSTMLTLTKSFRSALSLPTGITMDDDDNRVYAATYLETNTDSGRFSLLKDSLISTILEGFVIASWHGAWTIADAISTDYFKASLPTAGIASYVIGLLLGILCLFAQFPLYEKIWIRPGRSHLLKLFFNYFYTLVALLSTILTFRGVWYSWDSFFLTDNRSASLILGQILGGLTLFCVNCGSCLHAGIVRDLDPKESLVIPYHYFTRYYAREVVLRNTSREVYKDSTMRS